MKEWALLTNGKSFEFYKILFNQPIESRKIFSVDLADTTQFKNYVEFLQYLHKDAITKKSLRLLWNKCEALHPMNVGSILYSKEVVTVIKKLIKAKYGEKCDEDEVIKTLNKILDEKIDHLLVKHHRTVVRTAKKVKELPKGELEQLAAGNEVERVEEEMPGEN